MKAEIIDGFVWAVIEPEYTEKDNYTGVAYCLYDDGTEALIEDDTDWDRAHALCRIGMELGHEAELKSDWQEATARNNENRSFEAWLQDKAEALIN